MKWFKHYSGATNSESLSDLIRDTGLAGYARYWLLLEHLAHLFEGESVSFRVPIENVRGLLRIRSWTELESFLERLTNVRGLDIKRIGNVYEIKASILLELQDRDFKKARKDSAQSAPKIKNKDKELDKELDIDTDVIVSKNIAKSFKNEIEHIYADLYPLKKGKTKGVEKLSKEIKSDEDLEKLKLAITNYSKTINDPKYIKHFSTFASEWKDYLDANVGKAIVIQTKATAVFDTARDQIERIEKGLL